MAKKITIPAPPEQNPFDRLIAPDIDLVAVWCHLFQFDDGRLVFGRETEPRFNVPVVRDDAGQLHFDRDNVEWIDGVLLQEERDRILDQYDKPASLQKQFDELRPVSPEMLDNI